MEKSSDAKPPKKQQRRWGRSITTEVSETQGKVDCVAATRPSLVQDTSVSTEDPTPSADNDSARDVRRLRKALREIGDLEVKQASGQKLRRNQTEKIEKKKLYLHELQRLAPELG